MDAASRVVRTKSITGKKAAVEAYGIKSGIAKEGLGVDKGVCCKKVLQSGDKQPGIMDGLILIGRIRFLPEDDLRMFIKEILVIELDMPDNAESIGDNAKFIGIAEMAVNVELLNVRISGGMGGHRTVSCFVGIIIVIEMHSFGVGFELLNDTVGILRVIFGNPGFNAGGIKDGHTGLGRIDCLADWFGKINQA